MWKTRNGPRWVARRQFIKTVAAFPTASIFADLGNPTPWAVLDAFRVYGGGVEGVRRQ